MKVLIVDIASYVHFDMMEAVDKVYGKNTADELYYMFKGKDNYYNEEFAELFNKMTKKCHYDCVMSTNFIPVIATLCHEKELPYIAWTYDTPMNMLPGHEMTYETNTIFLFDRIEMQKYRDLGYDKFYHMPLAVNTDKYDKYRPSREYRGDISFMGKLYRHKIAVLKDGLNSDLIEYIDKLIALQRQTFGKYIVDDLISQPIVDEFNRQYKESGKKLQVVKEQISFTIAEYVTYLDRLVLLEMLARRYDTHLYTYDIGDREKEILKNVKIHGPLEYHKNMATMFKSNKINLNGSMRAAKSAIPMRALDIIGCKAFLLSAAQPELEEYFEEGKEVVLYRSEEEAVDLAGYYLEHEEEREKIATAGYERAKKDFRYEDRIRKMFEIAGIK